MRDSGDREKHTHENYKLLNGKIYITRGVRFSNKKHLNIRIKLLMNFPGLKAME